MICGVHVWGALRLETPIKRVLGAPRIPIYVLYIYICTLGPKYF